MLQDDLIFNSMRIAIIAHQNQKRFGGIPYIIHPIQVSEVIKKDTDDINRKPHSNKPIKYF